MYCFIHNYLLLYERGKHSDISEGFVRCNGCVFHAVHGFVSRETFLFYLFIYQGESSSHDISEANYFP